MGFVMYNIAVTWQKGITVLSQPAFLNRMEFMDHLPNPYVALWAILFTTLTHIK